MLFTLSLNARRKSDRSRPPLRFHTESSKTDLVYVNNNEPGIERIKRGHGFVYIHDGRLVRDRLTLERIKSLVIPPAWTKVWICLKAEGHIQATGFDARGRKQYRYHPEWNRRREKKKFYKLMDLGKRLPVLRRRVEIDLKNPGLSKEKVLATAVKLIEKTSIRIGNTEYERSNGSFGLTTLKDKHAQIHRDTIKFSFKGKKGVSQSLSLTSRRLARIVKACRDIPGKELFQYLDDAGRPASIDSGMVNGYIRAACGDDFTAKDLRTWCGSIAMLTALKSLPVAKHKKDISKNILTALDAVSGHLGNTRSVCRSYYVHPRIISLYESGALSAGEIKSRGHYKGLSQEENIFMDILENSLRHDKTRRNRPSAASKKSRRRAL